MLYLASTSPQRSDLLTRAGIDFQVVTSTTDESTIDIPHPQAMASERARAKAEGAVLAGLSPKWDAGDAVLAADTVVAVGRQIYGKPADDDDAMRILAALSGTTHTVTTAHALMIPQADAQALVAVGVSMTQVTMRPLMEDEIRAYVASGESNNRAGAYAIQEHGDRFVVELKGSFDTVVGLHVNAVRRLYRECTGTDLACTVDDNPYDSGEIPVDRDTP